MTLRDVYAEKAISQIPRLLGLQDRNPFSPTYGCFHRDYWLDKTSDFPDAVRQFGVQSLALVYKHDFPANPYKGQAKIRDWAIAGLKFWASIQHPDGSFDEFYPYERGWVGPSAFTTFTAVEAVQLLNEEMDKETLAQIRETVFRAARFIISAKAEEDHLANHHAMACLAVWKAYRLLGEAELKDGFEKLFHGFTEYHNSREGWSREYDGVDPGYLSATVSFFGKIYQDNPDPRIFEVLKQSVEFSSYFVYPNGYYAGSMGSRNTLHFYPHGYEILANQIPLAGAIAEKMLQSLSEGKLVPPEIISDRYVFYRVPEFLQSYLDCVPRRPENPPLPYERPDFVQYFTESRIFAAVKGNHYVLANLAKGGVAKIFDIRQKRLLLNDCGLIGRLQSGETITSQWVDPEYECNADSTGWSVSGFLHEVPSNKLFTPFKNVLFRAALVALGWMPWFSHWLKGSIRRALMLGRRPVAVRFRRSFALASLELTTEVMREGGATLVSLSAGDEFFVRYVPQSRYFQLQELGIAATVLEKERIDTFNSGKTVTMRQSVATQESRQPEVAESRK
jgi:hypothetical protein